MDNGSIGVIVHSDALLSRVRDLSVSLGAHVRFAHGWDQETILKAGLSLKNEGIRALLARGPWLSALHYRTNLPVFDYNPTASDLLQALVAARRIAHPIGVVDVYGPVDWQTVQELMGVQILVSCPIRDPSDSAKQVSALVRSGARVLLGGRVTLEVARRLGVPGVYLESGSPAIESALSRATDYVNSLDESTTFQKILDVVLSSVDEGVIVCDSRGSILAANKQAARTFGADLSDPDFDLSRHLALTSGSPSARTSRASLEVVPVHAESGLIGQVVISRGKAGAVERARGTRSTAGFAADYVLEDFVGCSPASRSVVKLAMQCAATDLPVLIMGETGTGKELIAQGIHNASRRAGAPFVAVNCSAIPESLLESELFGYEEGAFTGTRKGGKPGLFEVADGGTLFLDETSAMPLTTQTRLLRVLESQSLLRLGGQRSVHVDTRVVAASNRDLASEVRIGRFRSDMYFRLAVLTVWIPPLRDRPEDLDPLLRHFLGITKGEQLPFSAKAWNSMRAYLWPGNVRELRNVADFYRTLVASGISTSDAEFRTLDSFLAKNQLHPLVSEGGTVLVHIGSLRQMMREMLGEMLRKHSGSISSLSASLGVSRSGLWKMLKRNGLLGETEGPL